MSVQPKGSPMLRKKFLMQLPQLMKDLNEGMALIGWPDPAQKAFFAQLLPAHAESLKAPPLSELDHNLLAKQVEGVFTRAIPAHRVAVGGRCGAEVENEVIERRFTPEEARQVGLIEEARSTGRVRSTSRSSPAPTRAMAATPARRAAQRPGFAAQRPGPGHQPDLAQRTARPSRGPQLMDHIKLGFAYQMHLKDEWQKVRLTT